MNAEEGIGTSKTGARATAVAYVVGARSPGPALAFLAWWGTGVPLRS